MNLFLMYGTSFEKIHSRAVLVAVPVSFATLRAAGRRPHARRVTSRTGAWLLALLVLIGCAPGAPALVAGPVPTGGRRPHIVVISIDGLRPDAIRRAGATTLSRLADTGAWTWEAETIVPSRTLPSHASMLTGVGPEVHGIDWNSDQTGERGTVGVPTVFETARQAGLQTSAFFAKSKLRHLIRPGSLDWVSAPRGMEVLSASRMAADVVQHLRSRDPDLLFVHIAEPDLAGHSFGWNTLAYRWAVRRADAAVGRIIAAASRKFDGNVVVIVTADHGGDERNHGSTEAHDVQIPWIAWGAGVNPGRVNDPVSTMDTAATALWLLGVPIPEGWTGRPVRAAFPAPVPAP